MYKLIILKHLPEYLKKKNIPMRKSGKTTMVKCPFCQYEKDGCFSGSILSHLKNRLQCWKCGKNYDLLDVVKHLEGLKPDTTEEQYLQYLKDLLDIKIMTKTDELNIEKYLDFYVESGFDLVPIAHDGKVPIEKDWTNKNHTDKEDWQNWLTNDLNIGVKTGIKSNIIGIDIDALNKKEKKEIREGNISEERRKELLAKREKRLKIIYDKINPIGNPLIQETLGGHHLFYEYDKDIPKTFIKIDDIHLDIESEGGYILLFPSTLKNDTKRNFQKLKEIPKMPEELKQFLLSKIDNKKINKTHSEEIREDILTENFKIKPEDFKLKDNNLEGTCNSSFIKLGGMLRKQLNSQQTGYVLRILNNHMLEDPMNNKSITAMIRELEKYDLFDEKELAHRVLEHLKETDEMSRTEMAMTIVGTNRGEDKKRIDKALQYLVKEGYVLKKGKNYSIIRKAEWKTNLIDIGIPIDFKMPYFYDIMNFNFGDLILIGSRNSAGKTHISMNIIKQLVEQGITPYYLSLESGSRWAKIALQLGLKEGDFKWEEVTDETQIELEKKAITVVDWVCPNNYAETDKLFKYFTEKLQKTQGVAIVFVQLRDNNEWLAKDLIKQFPAFACRYVYDNDDSGEYGKFIIDKIREAKIKMKAYSIPCQYDWEEKTLRRVDELEKESGEE